MIGILDLRLKINAAEQTARLSSGQCAHGLLDITRVAREILDRLERIDARISALESEGRKCV